MFLFKKLFIPLIAILLVITAIGATLYYYNQRNTLGALRQPSLPIDLASISGDMIPETDNVFDLGGVGQRWKSVRIGTDLFVDGDLTVTNGTPGVGKVLTSDANGLSSWQDPAFSASVLSYSTSTTYAIGDLVTVFGIPFINKTAVTVGETFVPVKWIALIRNLKTGVLSGGLITISGAGLTFDISAMTGIIVDNTDPQNYLVTPIDFPETLNIANTNLGTGTSQILVDVNGNVLQLAVRTVDDELQNLSLGRTSNSGGIAVNRVVETKTAYSIAKTTQALLASIGGQSIVSTIFEPGAIGLTLNTPVDSKILSQGRNFPTDSDNPDIADVLGQTPITAPKFFRTFITDNNATFNIGALVNEVDNSQYNPLGDTLVAVPAGKFQVQRVYTFGGTSIHVFYYGRTLYDSLEEALQSFDSSDEFTEHQVTSPGAFSAHVIVQEGITDWSDPTTFQIINRTGGIVGSFDRGIPSGGVGGLTAAQKQSSLAGKSTGVFSGGGLSGTVGQTTFDIATGTGQVIDNTVPGTTTEDPYEWNAFAAVSLTNLATAKHTFIFLKKVANIVTVVQIGDDSVITEIDRKNMLYLGVIRHGTGTFVGSISQPQTVVSPVNKLIDFYIATGKVRLSSGNEITATGAGLLTIDKGLGKSYGIGVNAFNDGNNTDFVDNPALAAVSMLKYSSVGHIDGALISNIDTSRFDPNGATTDSELVALTGGATRVVHRIWIEAVTNLVIFQYGQASYATEDDAIANFNQEDLSLPTGLNESSYLREVIVVQNGVANLDSAVFIPVEGVGGSGGQVQPTNVIDNLLSTDPNSALSANQGRLLDGQDLANSFLSGANIVLQKKGGASIVVTNGAANIANANLTFNANRVLELNTNTLLIQDGANGMFVLDGGVSGQAALFHNTSGFRANANGLELVISGTDDLKINGLNGGVGNALLSQGANLPPVWGNAANIANSNLKLDAARTVDLDTFPLLFIGIGAAGTPIFQLDPGNRAIMSFLGNGLEVNGTGLDLTFIPGVGDLEIDGDSGTSGQVITSNGVGNPPTWSTAISVSGNSIETDVDGVELTFATTSDLQISGDAGSTGQALTSNGANLPPTWSTPAGALDANSYISINGTDAGVADGVTPILSSAGFGNNYNVLPLVDVDLERTNDPSGMITGNTLDIKVAGVYEIHWSYFETIGGFSYGNIRVNGVVIASGRAGRDLNGQVSTTATIVSLVVGDKIEFASTIAITADALRKPSVFLNQIR